MLERRQYQAHPPRYEYLLTELGWSLRPVVVVLAAWGNARLAPEARSMVLVDADTGAEAEPVVVDRISGRRVDGSDFVFAAGAAASQPFRDRYAGRPTPRRRRRSAASGAREGEGRSRSERIMSRVRRIPEGRVMTYGDIDPQAPRVVGQVLHRAGDDVPWHRVVRADGTMPMGDHQRQLLLDEGVPMRGDHVDLRAARA